MTKALKATPAKPNRIAICELAQTAFDQAAIFVTDGYRFCPHNPPVTYAHGYASIELVRGAANDDPAAFAAAAVTLATAVSLENAQDERAIADALAQSEAQQKRDAAKAALALEVEAVQAHLKQLQAAHRKA